MMGLFGKSLERCSICGGQKGMKQIADGYICKDCIAKYGIFLSVSSWNNISLNRVKDGIAANEMNQKYMQEFKLTKKIEKKLWIDEINRLWTIDSSKNVIFSYGDILDYELFENGENIIKGGFGSAVVGGVLFGGIGALVGGVASTKKIKKEIRDLQIKIKTKNLLYPEIIIPIISSGKVDPNDPVYDAYIRVAESFLSAISLMLGEKCKNEEFASVFPSDEILKYKNLLDVGAITQEEYDAKKKQLLNL